MRIFYDICDMENITFKDFKDLMVADRSIRRFDASRPVSAESLLQLVELTRYCASGRNLQPLRYMTLHDDADCDRLFPLLAWAGYYTHWAGPDENERPRAYLVQCLDTRLTQNPMCDEGLQLQAITLGARTMGLGCCIIKAFNAPKLKAVFGLPDHLEPRYVLAIGYPAEIAKVVDMAADGEYKYYRDADDNQCVPKRSVEQLIIRK